MKTLSILVPLYNEEKTVVTLLKKVIDTRIPRWQKEVIVVDDGSTDGSFNIVKERFGSVVRLVHQHHRGRGRALIHGLSRATGDTVIFQDADLEYDPSDWSGLLEAMGNSKKVVYGSRVIYQKKGYFFYVVGARCLTKFVNLLFGSKLTDIYTGYKLFSVDTLKSLNLESDGFGLEPEITCKLLKKGIPIVEVPIRYAPRSFQEGKKITAWDGIKAFFTILKYRLVSE